MGASQVAARQQTALSTLDNQATQTQDVLRQSQAASGEIQQLQLIAQMIGITNSELLVLNQTLATTGRVLTDMAAPWTRPSGSCRSARATMRAGIHGQGRAHVGPDHASLKRRRSPCNSTR